MDESEQVQSRVNALLNDIKKESRRQDGISKAINTKSKRLYATTMADTSSSVIVVTETETQSSSHQSSKNKWKHAVRVDHLDFENPVNLVIEKKDSEAASLCALRQAGKKSAAACRIQRIYRHKTRICSWKTAVYATLFLSKLQPVNNNTTTSTATTSSSSNSSFGKERVRFLKIKAEREFAVQSLHVAAFKIQSTFRKYKRIGKNEISTTAIVDELPMTRSGIIKRLKRDRAAVLIQSLYRGRLARRKLENKVKDSSSVLSTVISLEQAILRNRKRRPALMIPTLLELAAVYHDTAKAASKLSSLSMLLIKCSALITEVALSLGYHPDNLEFYRDLGNKYYEMLQLTTTNSHKKVHHNVDQFVLARALWCFEKIKDSNDNTDFWEKYSMILYAQGLFHGAQEALCKAQGNENTWMHVNCLWQTKSNAKKLVHILTLLKESSTCYDSQEMKLIIARASENFDAKKDDGSSSFRKSLPETWIALGDSALKNRHFPLAIDFYTHSLRSSDKKNIRILTKVCWAFHRISNDYEMIKICRSFLLDKELYYYNIPSDMKLIRTLVSNVAASNKSVFKQLLSDIPPEQLRKRLKITAFSES